MNILQNLIRPQKKTFSVDAGEHFFYGDVTNALCFGINKYKRTAQLFIVYQDDTKDMDATFKTEKSAKELSRAFFPQFISQNYLFIDSETEEGSYSTIIDFNKISSIWIEKDSIEISVLNESISRYHVTNMTEIVEKMMNIQSNEEKQPDIEEALTPIRDILTPISNKPLLVKKEDKND